MRRPSPDSRSRAWDSYLAPRPLQGLWVSLGVLALLPGVALTTLRVLAPTEDVPALFASFTPYGVLTYLLASVFLLIALVRARRRVVLALLTAVTVGLLGCHVSWVAPLFTPDHREATTPTFALMTLNTRNGRADATQIVQRASRADMVVLLEATSALVAQLRSAGWDERFPYASGVALGVAGDTVLYSRYPLSDSLQLPNSEFQQWQATADVPRVGRMRVIAAHPCNPFCGSNLFRTEHQQLQTAVEASLEIPLIVAGDLNAIEDHAPMRALRRLGLRSATDLLGAGWQPTYPADATVPPLLPIDHVLLNRFLTVTSIERFDVTGSDHFGLMVQIAGA